MKFQSHRNGVGKALTRVMTFGLVVGMAACDTDVVNPGPISADFLNDPAAQAAITNGAGRATGEALNWIAYTTAATAREVHPSGSTGSFGITPKQQEGLLEFDEIGTHWSNAHRARFLAVDGLERILALDAADQDQENLAQLYLWAGYNSRLMGEMFCNAVIDGGAAQDSDVHLTEALAFFEQAEALGSGDVVTAAIAGQASVQAFLGNWTEAADLANDIPADFSYVMPYFDLGDDSQANRIYVAGKALPYKAHSQIFTWIEQYNPEAGGVADTDPRVAWRVSGENGDAASSCCGIIPWNPQTKYEDDNAPIELSSFEEMQLILAENELVTNNDPDAAVAIVNALRAAAGVNSDLDAGGNADTAWMFLMREHAIEQWLEGRRLPAMRRWNDAGVDLESLLQPLEQVGDGDTTTGSHLSTRDFCIPISEAEVDTNPNISG